MHQIAFVLLAVVGGGLSQVIVNGTCPFDNVTTTGNLSAINGTWYQIESIGDPKESGDCATTRFNDNMTAIFNREIVRHKAVVNNGTITVDNKHHSGSLRFNVTFPGHGTSVYYLITNNNNYALIAICDNTTVINNVTATRLSALKLSRNKSLVAKDKEKIEEAIKKYFSGIPALARASWRALSFSKEACRSAGSVVRSLVALVSTLLLSVKLAAL